MTCADCIHVKVCHHYLGRITGGKVADPSKACADNCYMFDPAQKFGEWYRHNKKEHGDTCYYCSACERMALTDGMVWELTDYCPRCGARMDGGEE